MREKREGEGEGERKFDNIVSIFTGIPIITTNQMLCLYYPFVVD